jgi:glucose/arabinose dehydrogenase
MKSCLFIFLALIFCIDTAIAQRGLPPRAKTRSPHVTKYAEHLDFLPPMVKLLNVPRGWEVHVAAFGLGRPRMLYSMPGGHLYVTRRDGGDVLMLTDKDGDNKFEDLVTVAADFRGVHGITVNDNWMYLCNNNELRRYKILPDGKLSKEWETLIDDLPSGGQHPNRTIDFGPDGMLYISVGTLCNDCKENDREVASILQVDPATWKRQPFATGLRNTIGFDWHPVTNELWGIDNGSDGKGNRWPPEEVNHIVQGGMYGYPFVYGKNEVDQSREDPAGDVKEEWAKNAMPSSLELPAHLAPIGFQFFGASSNIPSDFSGDGLVCWHGSWNKSKPVGFKVQRIVFENGTPMGAEDFLTGFLKPGFPMFRRKARFGRPSGISITPEGVVYVSDDANGVIYAVKRTTKDL